MTHDQLFPYKNYTQEIHNDDRSFFGRIYSYLQNR
ncbi:unnamed protein product [Amoebophrya sp. A25]|nr:unnamed protein product [Amoebophrya sp. A25]|eukprot:GSA25T00016767001.1